MTENFFDTETIPFPPELMIEGMQIYSKSRNENGIILKDSTILWEDSEDEETFSFRYELSGSRKILTHAELDSNDVFLHAWKNSNCEAIYDYFIDEQLLDNPHQFFWIFKDHFADVLKLMFDPKSDLHISLRHAFRDEIKAARAKTLEQDLAKTEATFFGKNSLIKQLIKNPDPKPVATMLVCNMYCRAFAYELSKT